MNQPQDKHWIFLVDQTQSNWQTTTNEIVNNTTPQQVQDINNLNDKIGNLSPQDVGTYQGGHVDVTAGFQQQYQQPAQQQYQQPVQTQTYDNQDYGDVDFDDDLPF